MVMVRTMESSQWRAVAVPWAWKARRMGCEVSSRGGSVVLEMGLESDACDGAAATHPRSG